MFNLDLGGAGRYCDGLSRRSFLKLGVSGMASLGLPQVLKARERSGNAVRNTSVILIWLDGGPGHMDMYDMKPDAPAEYRGIWRPIRTRVPGFDVTELYPKQAQITDMFSMVRSLHHDTGDHFAGGHRMLTTKDMGVSGANNDADVPRHRRHRLPRSRPAPPGMPGLRRRAPCREHRPEPRLFRRPHARRPAQPVRDRRRPEQPELRRAEPEPGPGPDAANASKIAARSYNHFDRCCATSTARHAPRRWTAFTRKRSISSPAPPPGEAFDINSEDPALRDRYGRHNWGQSTLLARRLVEAGSTFVTVHFGGWDHHWDLQESIRQLLCRWSIRCVSACSTDLRRARPARSRRWWCCAASSAARRR